MSELSTVAIKDGHRGHLPHHGQSHGPSGLGSQLDAERADRISRLAGLERVTTARNPTPLAGNLPPGATGSVGAHTTWAGSEAGDADKMSESQDMDMDNGSVDGMSEEGTPSLVAFGEGARTPARQSTIGSPSGGKATTPTGREAKMIDGMTYDRNVVDTTSDLRRSNASPSGMDEAERIVRENMNTTSADRMRGGARPGDLGKFGFEK